jgi:hypothetical protein
MFFVDFIVVFVLGAFWFLGSNSLQVVKLNSVKCRKR